MNRSNTVTVGVEYQRLSQREEHEDDADSAAGGASSDSETEEWSVLGSPPRARDRLVQKQRFDLKASRIGRVAKMKIEVYEVSLGALISYCLYDARKRGKIYALRLIDGRLNAKCI